MFCEVNPTGQGNGTWATLENLERPNTVTRESDVFAFGMVMMEVRACTALRRWSAQRLNPAQGFHGKGHIR